MGVGIGKHQSLETAKKSTVANVGKKEILKRERICCISDNEKLHLRNDCYEEKHASVFTTHTCLFPTSM